ncbi:hypothetical protein K438DRAFT_1750287 [Mycena galopus ATCC 62051]|nr:hypothetical protein K438DRAFT_1750287 [Mycena galopus ATCC 62051]
MSPAPRLQDSAPSNLQRNLGRHRPTGIMTMNYSPHRSVFAPDSVARTPTLSTSGRSMSLGQLRYCVRGSFHILAVHDGIQFLLFSADSSSITTPITRQQW